MNNTATFLFAGILFSAGSALATEYHVAKTGDNTQVGSAGSPLKTIQAAADLAQPGDTITVHAGVYRERVDPPRGGASDARRITYQAAPGEKVVITGAEPMKGWQKVEGDVWKVVIPNAFFGDFNPFTQRVHGEWCGRGVGLGMVYLDGEWFAAAASPADVRKPAKGVKWCASAKGQDAGALFALKSVSVNGKRIAADAFSKKKGALHATACADRSGQCVGWIDAGSWLGFDKVDFGQEGVAPAPVEVTAGALADGGRVELRLDAPDGKLLGTCCVDHTGGWQAWRAFAAPIAPVHGMHSLYLVFKNHEVKGDTTVWAQFPGVDPNASDVEINVRQSVFYPSKPGINYITVRGFELRQAATPWAGAMSEQVGLIGTHWSKGWIIENNDIHHSICTGVTLGRYALPRDEFPAVTAPGFVKSIELALRDGWSKDKIGGHVVRNNRISHCEKNGIHGSLGASFCEISGNDIHDIATRRWVRGADTGGIKFLGGVDMVIRDNHIHRCGAGGVWLDWMAQGAVVTGNLLHDNGGYGDIFFEMQHGPLTFANNILLSKHALNINSEGLALVHNLVAGVANNFSDPRQTPFLPAHGVAIAGLYTARGGDHRVYNNIFTVGWGGQGGLPNVASGNVFAGTARPFASAPSVPFKSDLDPQINLVQKNDGWYLTLNAAPAWRAGAKCKLVTTDLLGKAKVSGCAYENADGTPLKIDTDYFGKPRDPQAPFPGPFETVVEGVQEVKVWPK